MISYNAILKHFFGLFEILILKQHIVGLGGIDSLQAILHFLLLNLIEVSHFILCRLAPSSDPFLSVRYYERTKEQQASLGFLVDPSLQEETERQVDSENRSNIIQREPHGSVGAIAGQRAIAQGKTEEVAAALCRYSAPEEVYICLT